MCKTIGVWKEKKVKYREKNNAENISSYKYWVNENCVPHDRRTLVYYLHHDLDCEIGMENAVKKCISLFLGFNLINLLLDFVVYCLLHKHYFEF
jgi:hypothetical protein